MEAEIDRLPIDVLAQVFVMIPSFTDLARASGVCRKWKRGVKLSLGRRERLSFALLKMDDDSTSRIIGRAYAVRELDMYSLSLCLITRQMADGGLLAIC